MILKKAPKNRGNSDVPKRRCRKTCKCCRTLKVLALTILLSSIAAVLLIGIGSLMKNIPLAAKIIDSINNEWYINTYFSQENAMDRPTTPDDILIVDVGDSFSSRKDFAEILKIVAAQKPQIICIDFIFSDNESYDTAQNNCLYSAIKEIKDSTNIPIVVVGYKGNSNEINHSFFTKPLNLQFGLSDFAFGEYVSFFDDTIPRISLKIVQLLGKETNTLPDRFVVNYRRKFFEPIDTPLTVNNKSDLCKIASEISTNYTVLIGTTTSSDDVHKAPFLVNDENCLISGVEIVAYELSSLLSYFNKSKDRNIYPYTFLTFWENLCLFGVLSITYLVFFVWLPDVLPKKAKSLALRIKSNLLLLIKSKTKQTVKTSETTAKSLRKDTIWTRRIKNQIDTFLISIFLPSLFFLLAEFLMILLCFCFTTVFFKIPNISFFMASLLFVNPAYSFSQNHIPNSTSDEIQ